MDSKNKDLATGRPKKIELGELLVEHGIITQEQLTACIKEQKVSGHTLEHTLVKSGYLTQNTLLIFLAKQLKIPFIDLRKYETSYDLIKLIPQAQARRFRAIALEESPDGVVVGMADPTDIFAYDELLQLLKKPIQLAFVAEDALLDVIDREYRNASELTGLAQELEHEIIVSSSVEEKSTEVTKTNDTPVVKLLNSILADAALLKASDIHIEPEAQQLRVRFRIDGHLHVQMTADNSITSSLMSRLKLMAGLDIAEKRLPQDGRFQISVANKVINIRLSTMPVQYGESAVMRLLNQSDGVLSLEEIGMSANILKQFRSLITLHNGMVLVAGPTGSGKTTTLYGALEEISNTGTKTITVEDPVEYRLPGISQVQVNPKIGLGFAHVLRSILRQDPDIVLLGEMRDAETMEIGLRAAMTGHMLLSTIHTNDAVSTIMRMMDMGAEPYLIAAALRGILAQRLIRRVCPHCAEPEKINDQMKVLLVKNLGSQCESTTFLKGKGCQNCNKTGYSGRIAIHELVVIDQAVANAIQKTDFKEFSSLMRQQSTYQRFRKSAFDAAAQGLTTAEQTISLCFNLQS